MSHRPLSETIQNAELRAQQSAAAHEAKKKVKSLPWLSAEQALPQNDFATQAKERRLFLVRLMPGKRIAVAHFGYQHHDWWISPTGRLFAPHFGHTVVGWCPLPSNFGKSVCDDEDDRDGEALVPVSR